ncbi:rhamnulokinase family protein [Acidobacteriota bacterium]
MGNRSFLAFDIGAESGRAVVGEICNKKLNVREVYRFSNGMIKDRGHLHWDMGNIFNEVRKGIREGNRQAERSIGSLGIDTWGVDFGLVDREGVLLSHPFAYRDSRNEAAMKDFLAIMSEQRIYDLTGIQFLQFNSVFQLYAHRIFNPDLLERAHKLLFIPDILNYFLTDQQFTEFTFATTSQMYNPAAGDWEGEIFENVGITSDIMLEIVQPGTFVGRIKSSEQEKTGLGDVSVLAVATHDTGSAVAAVPAEDGNWAFISSGTWSIMGVETENPVICEKTRELNFTNEGGLDNTFRLCKNIAGLWLLQECRRFWAKDKAYSYADLAHMAQAAAPFKCFVDPDWPGFLNPEEMTEAISRYCRLTHQPLPESRGEIVRCILESLAFKYRYVLDELREVSDKPIEKIHIIGGGGKNSLLCQFTAEATGLPVFSGPIEATAVGNLMVQARFSGEVKDWEEMRRIISRSFDIEEYRPKTGELWDNVYSRFRGILSDNC